MNTISPLTSSTGLGSTTTRSSGQPSNWQRSFQSGDIFKATVLESEGSGAFLLDIGGESVTAQSTATLLPGQILQLQMVSSSPQQVELKIVSSTEQPFFGRSLTLVGENIDLSDLLQNLHQALPSPAGNLAKGTVLEANGQDSFILDIAGSRVEAQSTAALTPGQTLQFQVEATSPQIELQIVPSAQQQTPGGSLTLTGDTVDLSGTLTALQQATASSPGNAVNATVEQASGQNSYILDIGGLTVEAQSSVPLAAGQSLQVQVAAGPSQIELQIVPPAQQQIPAGSLTLTGVDDVLQGLLTGLQQAGSFSTAPIEGLSPASQATLANFYSVQQNALSGTESGASLKQLVQGLGLGMENQLAGGNADVAAKTLKAALLEVSDVFKDSASITDVSHRLIGTLEVFQMAQQHLENSSNFIAPLPLPFLKQGYLTVEGYEDKKSGSTSENRYPLRFSLHLSVSDLGNIRIDCLQYQDGLYIRFNTDSKEKSDFVESFSDELKQAITSTPLRGLSFSETAANPTAELIQRLYPQGTSILDTKI